LNPTVSNYCAEDARNGLQTIENYGAVGNIESVAFIGMGARSIPVVLAVRSTMPVAGAFRLD
jgi:hypothetical protein